MVSQKVIISNPSGLHARPASVLVQAAGKCQSDVILVYGEKRIQAKSILNLMAAAIKSGSEVVVECSGETEEEDLKKLVSLIENGLGE
ncbi:MAG: HPr family phosphocarrier protein [Lachnospiraceae bacterium]|nr:HPr family phosphocarrier protein [Lachnospiraceae bacterium]